MREVEVRAPDRPDRIRPTLRGLKITDISLLTFRSSVQVFSDKDYKPSPASSVLLGLTGDVKERAHLPKGAGNLVPGCGSLSLCLVSSNISCKGWVGG